MGSTIGHSNMQTHNKHQHCSRNLFVQIAAASRAGSEPEIIKEMAWRQERSVWERLDSIPEARQSTGSSYMQSLLKTR